MPKAQATGLGLRPDGGAGRVSGMVDDTPSYAYQPPVGSEKMGAERLTGAPLLHMACAAPPVSQARQIR
jgi:hypothetical protein